MKTVFLFKDRAMGDAILSLSALSYLRSVLPQARIIFGTPEWTAPLFPLRQSNYDDLYPLKKGWRGKRELLSFLLREKVDMVFECHQRPGWKQILTPFCRLAGIGYIGHHHGHHVKAGHILDQGVRKAITQRDLDGVWSGLRERELTSDIPSFLSFPPRLEEVKPRPHSDRTVVLGLVATRATKKWPLESVKELTKKLQGLDQSLKFIVPLSTSPDDQEIKRQVLLLNFPSSVEIVQLPLAQLVEELAKAELYIGNDTGIKHMCAALGLKTLTFFGPEEPLEWHPYQQDQHQFLFDSAVECRTLSAHFCGLGTCDSMICMKNLSVEGAFVKAKNLLNI